MCLDCWNISMKCLSKPSWQQRVYGDVCLPSLTFSPLFTLNYLASTHGSPMYKKFAVLEVYVARIISRQTKIFFVLLFWRGCWHRVFCNNEVDGLADLSSFCPQPLRVRDSPRCQTTGEHVHIRRVELTVQSHFLDRHERFACSSATASSKITWMFVLLDSKEIFKNYFKLFLKM